MVITPDDGEEWLANTFLYSGYFVDVLDRAAAVEVGTCPVQQMMSIPSHGIIVFATFTEVYALGMSGKRQGTQGHIIWTTDRLAWGEAQLTNVLDNYLDGSGWRAPGKSTQEIPNRPADGGLYRRSL